MAGSFERRINKGDLLMKYPDEMPRVSDDLFFGARRLNKAIFDYGEKRFEDGYQAASLEAEERIKELKYNRIVENADRATLEMVVQQAFKKIGKQYHALRITMAIAAATVALIYALERFVNYVHTIH